MYRNLEKVFGKSALALALILAVPGLTGCMTTAKEPRKQERVTKKSKARSGYYGLAGPKNKIDQRHLRRGQRSMFAPALDSY